MCYKSLNLLLDIWPHKLVPGKCRKLANGKLQGAVCLPRVVSKSSEEIYVFGLDGSLCEVQTAFCERNLESLKSYRIPAKETAVETHTTLPLALLQISS